MRTLTYLPRSLRLRSTAPAIPALTTLLLALTLAGCAVGPTYQKPALETPAAFKEAAVDAGQWKTAQPAENAARGEWWKAFGDDTLDTLQDQARDANQNLKAAAARLSQARALQRNAEAGMFPEVDLGFGPTRQRVSPAAKGLTPDAAVQPTTLWRAQANISYEADLFGRVSSTVDAATADAQAGIALFRSLQLALQADVAQQYFAIRQLDADQQFAANSVALRANTLKLMQRRFDEGDIGELDLVRARTELASAQAESLGVTRSRAVAEHALAILLGKTPAEFSLPPRPLTRIVLEVPAGLPSALLERRPDIAAAERTMAAANARIGAAKAAFFPQIDLTTTLGYESAQLGNLFHWSSRTFLLGPLIGGMLSMPLFDAGARQAGVDRASAVYEEDVATYRQTVLNAFREVEDNLATLRILADQIRAQDEAVQASTRAAHLSHVQYREGAIGFLNVIDADRTVLTQQRAAAQLEGERARATVSLIRAIGGGWELAPQKVAQR
ncbi:efflux transporter outer membrane subunit [Herbaspirillum sp. RTI4]|uniref:efflux transporter outer membrane subunit n=1 Tax=Herbaspirillum sp. RTI4 TaxID=3048640 RepID=UPI002AB497F2|nr:efflux transporter outer membrane subunit [Herbaspirillum sp. RTI4]MDY7577393.1 efflux transporter outer membrane subunit [Herbaspirillum sp. RTI4]MEA9983381.1 efflux transporter outer membrane subunit [Herbaspirillum sp. RTI4]